MTRKQWREIKSAYRNLTWQTRVSDKVVENQFIGTFAADNEFLFHLYVELAGLSGDDLAHEFSQENLDEHGNWTLAYSDMAHGVFELDGHYFWRELQE